MEIYNSHPKMSFAELTPLSLPASSSSTSTSTLDQDFSVQNTNAHEFHQFVKELEFDDTERAVRYEEVEEEEEDEDVQVKYPYDRKDSYEDLEERIKQKLEEDNFLEEIDNRAKDAEIMIKSSVQRAKMEAKSKFASFSHGSIYTCVICAKAFANAQLLQAHAEKAHNLSGLQHKCRLCGKGYKHRKNLVSHMAFHMKEFQCKECSLVFQSATSLTTHIVKAHRADFDDDEVEMKRCQHCKERVNVETLKRHEYYCKNKEKIAAQRAEKKALSVPPSPAMSTVSYASFASYPGTSSAAVSPVVSYRDKSCQVCGESFASRQSMLRHVGRKHPEAKNDPNVTAVRYVSTESPTHQYACTDCGKRLTTRAALTMHRQRAHMDSSRHECHICHKSYTVPSELRKHVQRVHEKNQSAATPLPDLDSIF